MNKVGKSIDINFNINLNGNVKIDVPEEDISSSQNDEDDVNGTIGMWDGVNHKWGWGEPIRTESEEDISSNDTYENDEIVKIDEQEDDISSGNFLI